MKIVRRSEWGATVGLGPAMRLPAREFYVHHQGGRASSVPAVAMRNIEATGRQRFGRFSYSYVWHPGGGGTILEGAGLTVGAHTGGHNSTSLAVCLAGNYDVDPCPDAAVRDIAALIRHLMDTGALVRGAPIRGHRDVKSTACPGRHAYARLPEIRAAVAGARPTPPPKPGGFLMALTDAQQKEVYDALVGAKDSRGNRQDRHVAATDRTETQVQWLVQKMRESLKISQADYEAQLIAIDEARDAHKA